MNDCSGLDKAYHWLSLYLVEGLGNVGAHNLLIKFGDPLSIFSAPYEDLIKVDGLGPRVAGNIVNKKFALDPEKELKKVQQFGARIISFEDPEYPPYLREIHDPPVILYAKGRPIPQALPFVAVVGSRHPTPYGTKAATNLGFGLARAGVGIISGLARGIDGAAHWGCIKADGFTIGVLGTGVDMIYPASNAKLFHRVLGQGTIVSEFPMGTSPEPRHFPVRNRIISGIAKAVVVVEATRKSGSLITGQSKGTHFLIKQGAKLVERAEDVLVEIGLDNVKEISGGPESEKEIPNGLDDLEQKIYRVLGDYPKHIDEIVRQLQLDPAQTSSALLGMELKGLVKQLPGKMFVR
ncbi:MAG: DNA-protecting protein DprA [Deltaproteobacteria bacterium]|nr:DNA-protecting protein DprA [Deltaproteobacteria bacterium]